MMMRTLLVALLIAGAAACRPSEPAALQEIAKSRSGAIDVVLLGGQAAVKQGKDAVTIEFRRASS